MPLLRRQTARALALGVLACLLLGRAAHGEDTPAAPAAKDPLVIGTWAASPESIVDADTVRILEERQSVRVLAIDAEEVFREAADRKAAAKDFAAYAKTKRGESAWPVKYGTPAGEAARDYAKALMDGVTHIRLERDAAGQRATGTYGRLLGHVFLVKHDSEVLLSEALIRAGHSPYFNKYGRSRRFDARLRAAQDEARKAKRGIWGDAGPAHYPDYDERLQWWEKRAAQVDRWRALEARADHVTLGTPDADAKLKALVGKEAVVFGTFDRELPVKTGNQRVFLLSHERRRGFPFVVFDAAVAKTIDLDTLDAWFVTLRGKITLYKERPQMVIESGTQISTR